MLVRGYSDLTATDLRRADELIVQLQTFLNGIAPEYGLSGVRPDGVFTGATEVLLTLILRAEGQPTDIAPGIGDAISAATGVSPLVAERWEWAILVAMQRAGRAVVPEADLRAQAATLLDYGADGAADGENDWIVPAVAVSAGVLALVVVALVATRRR